MIDGFEKFSMFDLLFTIYAFEETSVLYLDGRNRRM